jgi:hypothetical protein
MTADGAFTIASATAATACAQAASADAETDPASAAEDSGAASIQLNVGRSRRQRLKRVERRSLAQTHPVAAARLQAPKIALLRQACQQFAARNLERLTRLP